MPVCVTLYPSTESRPIITALLDTQPALVHSSLIALLHHTPSFVSSLLSSSHSLLRLLSLTPVAYREEMVHACTNKGQHALNQFFTLSLKDSLTPYLAASLGFLSSSLATVSVAHLSIYFRHLYANMGSLAVGDQSLLEDVYSRAAGMYSTLPDYLLAVDEIEVSSLHYYQQLYSRALSLPAFLTLLSTLRSSSSPRDKEVYASIIHTLFSEYPHLSSYPLPQLQLASLLFGCLISSFLTSLLRALALKLLLDALSSSSPKMRQFGCLALSQVRERLSEWPQYCRLLLDCEALRQNEPRLWEWVRMVVDGAPVDSVKEDVGEVREQLERQLVPAMRTGWVGVGPAHSLERESGLMVLSVGGDEGSVRDFDVGWMTDDAALDEGSEQGDSSVHSHPSTQSSFVPTRFTSKPPAAVIHQPSSSPLDMQSSAIPYLRTGGGVPDDSRARISHPSFGSSAAGAGVGDVGSGSVSGSTGRGQDVVASPSVPASDSRSPSPPSPPPGLFNIKPSPPPSSTAAMPTYASATNATPATSATSSLPSNVTASSLAAPTTAASSASSSAAIPSTPSRQPPSSAAPTFGSTLNIDSLLSAQRDTSKPLSLAPSDSMKDKIAFIINNVSATNLRSKGRELRALLKPEYYGYFARYLVIQRVSIEANFQKLYSSFLDAMDNEELNRAMIETTYDNIKVLLASDKVLSSSSERSLLKNLGSWLGLLTIAKNRPIRSKHLDLKALILEAVDSGRLIAVIPFCAKVLEACADSRVFRLPNPWLVGCAGLLKEIFDIPGLKLNLKFEIEVLFRTLGIVMRDIRASNLLRERAATSDFSSKAGQVTQGGAAAAAAAARTADRNGSAVAAAGPGTAAAAGAAAKVKRPSSPTGSTFTEESEEGSDALPGIGIPRATTPGGSLLPSTTSGFPPDASMLVPNLPTYVQINPTIPLFSMFPHLKRTVPTAIDRAIREIISPVVERSVTIACVTTRELIMKDFAFESDETKMRAAAHSMVQNLTSSLALVTCKEPLRVSINNHLGSLLEANATNANDPNIKAAIEAACSTISNDNLELGCTLIEKAAAERAIREIDEALASAYTIRRKAREVGTPYLLYVQDPACLRARDMQILTADGFMYRDEMLAHFAEQPNATLDVACYSTASQQIAYMPIQLTDVLWRRSDGSDLSASRLVQFESYDRSDDSSMNVVVTADHVMYVQRVSDGKADVEHNKHTAEQLLRLPKHASFRFLSSAANGVQRDELSCASDFAQALRLTTQDELDAAVELYGYWLGNGSLDDTQQCITMTPPKPTDWTYLDALLLRLTRVLPSTHHSCRGDHERSSEVTPRVAASDVGRVLIEELGSPHSTGQRLYHVYHPAWWSFFYSESGHSAAKRLCTTLCRQLGTQHLRLMLRGMWSADGKPAAEAEERTPFIQTSSIQLRDDVQQACINAGYASYWRLYEDKAQLNQSSLSSQASVWRVYYSEEQASAPSSAMRQPVVHLSDVCDVRLDAAEPVWCVHVPHPDNLIIARRVTEAADNGTVVSASQPVIIGNCKPYVDMSIFSSGRFPASLPEALRAKSSGLSSTQLRVYEDFGKRLQQQQQMLAQQQTTATPGQASDSRARQQYPPTAAGAPVAGQPGGADRGVASRDGVAAAAGLAGLSSGSMPAPAGRLTGRSSPPPAGSAVASISRPVAVLPPTGNTRSPPLDPSLPHQAAIPPSMGFTGLTSQQTLEKLVALLAQLEQAVLRFPNHKSIPLHSLTQPAAATGQPPLRDDHEIQVSLRLISQLLSSPPRDEANYPREVVALTFAHKVFKRLYDRENRTSLLQIDVHTAVLKFVKAVCPKVVQELTGWLLFGDDDRKFIIPITVALLRGRLLASAEVDAFLNKLVLALQSTGQAVQTVANPAAASSPNVPPTIQVLHQHLDFVFALIRRVVIKRPILQAMELKQTLESLNALAHTSRHKLLQETIGHLLDDVRTAAINAEAAGQAVSAAERGVAVGVEKDTEPKVGGPLYEEDMAASTAALSLTATGSSVDDREDEAELAGLRPTVAYLLDEWMNICIAGTASDKTYTAYLSLLHQQRMISTPDTTNRFFKCIIALCVESSLQQQSGSDGQLSYTAIDALIKLFIFLVKFLDPPPPPNQQHTNHNKIRLLSSFLTASATVLRRDFQRSKAANQKPYLRLFNNLLHDLNNPDPLFDSNNVDVLLAFSQCFLLLSPVRVPGFTFGWLELISHRMYMSKLLISKQQTCSILFARLLCDLFRFQQPYLRVAELTDVIRVVYKATLRILLVLLHDFPEFLCDFHFSFCDVIPPSCIQMRNLILSAFPRNMRLPDPFTPNLKVDLLPEISIPPRIASDVLSSLNALRTQLQLPLDHYLKTRDNSAGFLQTLPSLLTYHALPQASAAEVQAAISRAGTVYNVPLVNSLVLYIGQYGVTAQAKAASGAGGSSGGSFPDHACMDVLDVLLTSCDSECRYYVINAIANQLRYPNNHTHHFSMILLYLFLHAHSPLVMEQITRVLLERLIVHRPHPWGLLITFIELIKNPRYKFWEQSFTRCAPEIERLFESVARSCMPSSSQQQQQQGTGQTGAAGGGGVGRVGDGADMGVIGSNGGDGGGSIVGGMGER